MDEREAVRLAADVRSLLTQWDAIGIADAVAAQGEYDCMIDPLLSSLRRGADAPALRNWIGRERVEHFGLSPDDDADHALADALVTWWQQRTTVQ
jgi:hypothetical protein